MEASTISWLDIGKALVLVAILAGAWVKLRKVEDSVAGRGEKREITGQPLTVKAAADFVHRADYDRDRVEIKAELARHASSRKQIYEQLDKQGRMIEGASTKTDLTYAQVQSLDAKIDRVLERLPRHESK